MAGLAGIMFTVVYHNESASIRTDSAIRIMEIIYKLIKNYTYGDFEKC